MYDEYEPSSSHHTRPHSFLTRHKKPVAIAGLLAGVAITAVVMAADCPDPYNLCPPGYKWVTGIGCKKCT